MFFYLRYDGRPDYRCVCEPPNIGDLLGRGDTKPHSDRQVCESARSGNQLLRRITYTLTCTGYSRSRYRINESTRMTAYLHKPHIRSCRSDKRYQIDVMPAECLRYRRSLRIDNISEQNTID